MKHFIRLICALSILASSLPALTEGAAMTFPNHDWQKASPSSMGLEAKKLEEAVECLEKNSGPDGVRELLMVRNGRAAWEGPEADRVHGVWSCTQSFTSAALVKSEAPTEHAEPIVFRQNGGWCWFQDERALIDDGKLIFASVAGTAAHGYQGGDIVVTAYDLDSGGSEHFTLHDQLEQDDHAAPALLRLPGGRYLAMYSKHGTDPFSRFRRTLRPGDVSAWTEERRFRHPDGRPTYSNLFELAEANDGKGKIYNFTRTAEIDPHVMASDDGGDTWRLAGRLLDWPDRPYLKYASDHRDTIHFIATDGHPRILDNNVYHGFLRNGRVYDSFGNEVDRLDSQGLKEKTLTRIFDGDPHNVAWTVDLELDRNGNPVGLLSVQKDGAAIRNSADEGPGWDHRYYYARWDEAARSWETREMAYAGTGFYPREADYTGLAALDPEETNTVFISADVHPRTGLPNVSEADGRRHYEIFKGVTSDGGRSWKWTAITKDSAADNIRPVIPAGGGERRIALWTRGNLKTYSDYDLDVVGVIEKR